MGIGRVGFSVFADAGTAYDRGTHLRDAALHRGIGAGVFLTASVFQLDLDVAVRREGGARVHLMTGFQF